ncbi:MAG: putative O-methyltransferase [Acidobacteria bacterium]|nr:putative O-methyltransferase [Acidobacteriota bacterium]
MTRSAVPSFALVLLGLSLASPAGGAGAPQAPADPMTPQLVRQLEQMRAADTDLLAVSEEDGRLLRLLTASNRTKRALEIGGANGYSAIWIGLGLRETGGRLVSIEYDPGRARQAAENVRRAGLSDIVTVVQGDAFKEIPKLGGEFDLVFLDAWKKDYKRFLDLTWPRLAPGGVFLGHNVVNKGKEMPDFLQAVTRNPAMLTAIVTPSGEGMSISYKRR